MAKRTFSAFVVEKRWWVIAGWIVLAALVMPSASRVDERLDVSASVPGSESARVQALIASRFPAAFPSYAVVVITAGAAPTSAAGRAILVGARERLSQLPFVTRTLSYLDAPDTAFVGPHGETYMVVGLNTEGRRPDDLVPLLRSATGSLEGGLRSRFPNISFRWTGEIPLNYDLRKASASDARHAERRVLPVTAILLVIAFGAVAAALLPVFAGALSISLALGGAVILTRFFPLSLLLQNIVAMLGLGLGIDYGLLVVGRFREALLEGMPTRAAAQEASRRAGQTIMLSGAVVAIAFASLLIVPVNEIRSIAVGGLLVIVVTVMLSTSLLPAILSLLGTRINAGKIPWFSPHAASDGWRRWGRFVCAHPVGVLVLASVPLAAIALQAGRLRSDLPRGDWLPRGMESSQGLRTLSDLKTSGIVNAVRVVAHFPKGSTWDSPEGWAGLRRGSDALSRDPRVSRVRSLTTVTGFTAPNLELLAAMPPDAIGSMATVDGQLALIEVLPSESAGVGGASELVRELREMPGASLLGLPGSSIEVGGLPALNVDFEVSTLGRFKSIVLTVVAVTLVSLMIGFRSPVAAIKAVALNLLSVAVAFGAVVLVFQDGYGIRALGLDSALGGTFPAIPVIVFCVVFGLSMDYEVFLVARIAEARASGLSDDESIVEGLARTGSLITSAAAIMIVVFAAFMLGDFVLIKILGFALSVAVLVDATVVRVAIGPALLKLGGRWNWWPGKDYRLVRSVPNIQLQNSMEGVDVPAQSVS